MSPTAPGLKMLTPYSEIVLERDSHDAESSQRLYRVPCNRERSCVADVPVHMVSVP